MIERVHVGVGVPATHRLGKRRDGRATRWVDDARMRDGGVAHPFSVDVITRGVEPSEESYGRPVDADVATVDVRLGDALTVVDTKLELDFGLALVEAERGLRPGVGVDRSEGRRFLP